LLLERLQSELPIQVIPVRVDAILDESVEEVREKHPTLKVEMDIDESITTDDQLIVQANPMLMRTCFRNLLDNAANYSADARLKVRILSAHGHLVLQFTNKGDRMLPDEIFAPFYRHPDAQKKQGSGLGLSIVAQIMSKLGG